MRRNLLAILALVAVLLTSCENFFTTSPLSFLQRDPSNLSDQQLITYAEDALASGDKDAMADAYDALKDSEDPEVQLLAVELALGAGALGSVLTETIANLSGSDLSDAEIDDVLNEVLSDFDAADLQRFVEAAALLEAADDTVTPSAEQYAYVALGLIAAAASDAGGVENLDPPAGGSDAEAYVNQATTFLNAAVAALQAEGESTDLLDGLLTEIDGV